ncbi:beta-carotene hydroxylase [Sulfolobales archaeon HS-7]|nr:beta-carotene hydroxylase [Sulfolobales archaeon HS-7]
MLLTLVAISVLTFFGMEGLARLMHKYVMHGFMWFLHEDHHRETQSEFEKNDAFGIIFALVAIYLIFNGLFDHNLISLSIGLGITAYGVAYFFVHDMIIHDRHLHLRSWGMRHSPFKELIQAHEVHHEQGEGNWGFLLIIPGLDKYPQRNNE